MPRARLNSVKSLAPGEYHLTFSLDVPWLHVTEDTGWSRTQEECKLRMILNIIRDPNDCQISHLVAYSLATYMWVTCPRKVDSLARSHSQIDILLAVPVWRPGAWELHNPSWSWGSPSINRNFSKCRGLLENSPWNYRQHYYAFSPRVRQAKWHCWCLLTMPDICSTFVFPRW